MPLTYEPIATTTLSSAQSSITFSSIPNTFTDIVMVISGTVATADNIAIQFNGDTASNYSWTYILGDGSSAVSGRLSNTDKILTNGFGTTAIGNAIYHIQSYANTNTNKTVINRGNRADNAAAAWVGLWRNTAAITSILIRTGGFHNLNSGFTATLYGIKAA